MTAYDDIKTARGAVDKLKNGANAINEMAKKATDLAEAGKELNKIQSVLNGVKAFGKLGTCFAIAGVGLDLVLFAFGSGAPDPNEMILNAISALDDKVDALWNAMDAQFDKIHSRLDKNSAKQNIRDEMKYFSALKVAIMEYRASPEYGIEDLLDDSYDPADIARHFNGIYDAVKSEEADVNILKAEYDSTCGDASTIINTGTNLLAVATFAPMAYALASALRYKKNPTVILATPQRVEDLFGGKINTISEQICKYTQMCWDEAKANVKKKMERDIFPNLEVPAPREIHETFRPSSKYLCEVLARQWPMFDWVVAVGRWDLKDYSKYQFGGITRLVWPNQRIKNCNVYVMVAWTNKLENKTFIPFDDVNDPNKYSSKVIQTDKNVAWSCYWTNPVRVFVSSYHRDWLTKEQQYQLMDVVEEQWRKWYWYEDDSSDDFVSREDFVKQYYLLPRFQFGSGLDFA